MPTVAFRGGRGQDQQMHIPPWADVAFAAGSLAMAVMETVRWQRGPGKRVWVIAYVGLGLAFLAFAAKP